MSTEPDPFSGSRMTLGEHLDELRRRLFKGLAAVLVCFVVAWFFREPLAEVVLRPYRLAIGMLQEHWVGEAQALLEAAPERPRTDFFASSDPDDMRLSGLDERVQYTGPGEGFFFMVKICLYVAVIAGSPVLLWQLWRFISAGLYRKEQRAVLGYFPTSLGMFAVGIGFGYFFMVPYAMYYLNKSVPLELARPDIKLESFLTFFSGLCMALGVVFQLPLVMTFLGRSGIVEPELMARYRGHFVVAAFVVAAILTPPDPITQTMLGAPMVILYEIGIWSARAAVRRHGEPPAPPEEVA